tara:strand:+ start:5249 stop:5866 length:618 start_codon:yes stop_codon:yes gene_type:complete
MLSGLLSAIKKAVTRTDVKSKASEARSLVRKNPKMTGPKEQAAIDKINAALDAKLAQIKKAGETDKKAPPQGAAAARAKAGSNKQQAMTAEKKGSIATRTASSKTAIDEAKTLKDVGIARTKIRNMEDADLRKFFLAELKKKETKIRNKQAGEATKVSRTLTQKQSDKKFSGYTPTSPFAKGGVVKGKSRTGHTDMRMGGIFYKN